MRPHGPTLMTPLSFSHITLPQALQDSRVLSGTGRARHERRCRTRGRGAEAAPGCTLNLAHARWRRCTAWRLQRCSIAASTPHARLVFSSVPLWLRANCCMASAGLIHGARLPRARPPLGPIFPPPALTECYKYLQITEHDCSSQLACPCRPARAGAGARTGATPRGPARVSAWFRCAALSCSRRRQFAACAAHAASGRPARYRSPSLSLQHGTLAYLPPGGGIAGRGAQRARGSGRCARAPRRDISAMHGRGREGAGKHTSRGVKN